MAAASRSVSICASTGASFAGTSTAVDGLVASQGKRKGSPCQQDDNSQGGRMKLHLGPDLPEDIWCHIHSLMPMRDANARCCPSRLLVSGLSTFLEMPSQPHFHKEILGLNENVRGKDEIAKDFTSKVECILKNHSGIGVKTLQFQIDSFYNMMDYYYLNSWLRIAVTPGIEELTVALYPMKGKYNFPCSLLSDGTGDSIRYLHLVCCDFRPTVGLVCLRSLTRLHLCDVRIMGDELGCILSNTLALERLKLRYCKKIICVKIPCLQRLSYLEVLTCIRLQVIKSEAPNLSSFRFAGDLHVQLSLGKTLQVKNLDRSCSGAVCYARAELPSSMPNLETLTIHSGSEMVNTPMVPSRFLHLKFLSVALTGVTFSPNYDYFSLVSFLDASPSLETFILTVLQQRMEHASIFGDPSDMRRMPEHHHGNLKSVKIIGFLSAKSLVELTCHILESTTSLECLTLDTTHGFARCSVNKAGKCLSMGRSILMEAHRALLAVQTYIKSKVPSTVELNVLEPCSRCHAVETLNA